MSSHLSISVIIPVYNADKHLKDCIDFLNKVNDNHSHSQYGKLYEKNIFSKCFDDSLFILFSSDKCRG